MADVQAEEWAVLAAPYILNLMDAPSSEAFNGTSMVRTTIACFVPPCFCVTCGSAGDARLLLAGIHRGLDDARGPPAAPLGAAEAGLMAFGMRAHPTMEK